jgi:uncharacterized protein YbjT (DUF2867 family)
MRMLVTGASGFAGSLLVGELLGGEHAVRALGRDPARVHTALDRALERRPSRGGASEVEIVRGDALSGEGLAQALEGIEVAYYLIHSMERASADALPFAERERIAAETFAAAAVHAGVRRIVYLGGLVPRTGGTDARGINTREPGTNTATINTRETGTGARRVSRHLASREAVERVLLEAIPDSVALRASIVIGARSRSFRVLVHLVERLPVLALPAWRRFRTQPIDARDIAAMLAAAATAPAVAGRSLDVGGEEALTYGEMIARIAELMLVGRPSLGLGVSATAVTARFAAAIAGEDPELMVPLMESLEGDLLPADDRAAELLNVELHAFDAAVEHALGEWEESEQLAAR